MLPVWKLIGFVLYVILYYSALDVYTQWPEESLKSFFFKVMPIVHLVFIVISTSLDDDVKPKSSWYRWNIALALIASGIGDCSTFLGHYPPIIMFLIAHLFCICAFGIRPVGSVPMAVSFAVAAVAYYFFLVDIMPMSLIKVSGIVYLVVLFTRAWRSMVVLLIERSVDSFLAWLGSSLFIVSDVLFIVDMFHGSFDRAPFWIMLTYYLAQLGLALSACNTYSQSLLKKND